MFRIHPRTLLKAGLLPTALLMAAGGVRQPGCRYRERHERHTRRAFAGQLLHHAAQPVAGRGPGRSPNQDHHLVPGRGRSARHAGGPERQRPAGWRHGVILAVRSRHRRPFGPDLDRRTLKRGRRVRGHCHRDDAEQRSHRHLRATRPYDQRTLTGAARGVPDYACTARAPALLPGPRSSCPGQQRRQTGAPAWHRRRRR